MQKQIAIVFLPLVLLVNCVVSNAAPARKRPERPNNTREEKNTKRARAEKVTTGRVKSDARAQVVAARDSKLKPRSKSSPREEVRANERASLKTLSVEKNSKRNATNREIRLAEKRRAAELRRAEERRRAEAERVAAIARERARNEELREHVQSLIAKDDLTGEDPEVRRVAVDALGNHAGTVVVMNPQTGRIYSMVNQQWALREGFKPCSTIKLVTSLAGLNENVIDPNDTTKISDTNQVSLTKALAYSRNPYFQTVGEQVGFDKMISYARRLGLGEKTGINARNEFQGRVPGSDSFRAIHRMSSHGDNYEVTALQLATLVSAIGNGGKLMTPYVVRSRQDETKLKSKVRRHVNIDREVWGHVVPGMVGAVNYGSGKRAYDPSQQVAGKTGTCIEDGTWVGLFTSYAPLVNPKLAVVVITRGADARSHFPAAVAGRIYRELGNRYGAPSAVQVAASRQVNSMKDSGPEETDDEEDSALAEDVHYPTETSTVFRSDRGTQGKVRPILMSIPTPRSIAKPTAAQGNEPAVSNGQTRPRRVMGR